MRLQAFLAFTLFHCALPFKGESYGIPALFDTLEDLSDEDDRKHAGTFNDPQQVPSTLTSTITPTKPSTDKLQPPDNFGIIEPFPRNIFAIEFTTANVTCVAYDSLGIKIPEKIIFVRRDFFGGYHELTSNGKLYFTKRTEEDGHKLFVTLHFLHLTMPDDSRYGPYECHAFAVNDSVARKHGFTVTVLRERPVSSRIHPRPSTVSFSVTAPPVSSRIPPKHSTASPVFMSSQVLPTPSGPATSKPSKTPTTPTAQECNCYQILQEPDRSQAYDYRMAQGGRAKCDDLLQTKWYRFVGLAGDRMPDKCVPSNHCGTRAAGWLRGGHPLVHDGLVSRTVCYHWINNCCWRSNNILVRNCGGFFVYRLQKPPGCQYRYCGVGYKAPTPTPTTGDECLRYKFLPEADRSQTYDYRKVSGGHPICDNTLQRDWYRFVGLAGDRMPDECVPSYHCGTHAAGWLRGGHPSIHDGVVSRTVCYHWIKNCCWRSNSILVRNCGSFYVYRLQKPPRCQYRYCGVGSPVQISSPECFHYKNLTKFDRAKSYKGAAKCDRSLSRGWYRFQGLAGKQMPDSCVPKQRCGTHAPGWLRGGHPTVAEGAVKRKVCFHWSSGCCQLSTNIRVRNCGAFYVYKLYPPPACSLRYCGDGEQAPPSAPECSFYMVLDKLDRSQGYIGVEKCDRSLPKSWYRFQGRAGKQMPQSCVPKNRCGTHAPGWLDGRHPKVSEGAVKRKVCFHWSQSCCRFSSSIRVRNCGAFYVYELDSTRFCSLRYCGDRM